jgi:hypothetical protein
MTLSLLAADGINLAEQWPVILGGIGLIVFLIFLVVFFSFV